MKKKIMFVDDEVNVIRSLKWLFSDEPYQFCGFTSPMEALEALCRDEYAVVVADHRMDEMLGTEFLEKVKEQFPDTVRIIATAYADMEVTINAINRGGVFRFLFKPWDDGELKQTIGNALAHYDLLTENRRLITILKAQNEELSTVNRRLLKSVEVGSNEIRRNEAEYQALEQQLVRAQRLEAIGTFARGIAHDFNNILSIMMGCSQLARVHASRDSKSTPYLEKLETAGKRAKELVKQIFSFSRQNRTHREPLIIHTIVDESLNLLSSILPSKISICREIQACGSVMTSEVEIDQVMMNLCTNAYHAMEKEGGTLTVGLSEVQLNTPAGTGDYVKLEVKDTGPGIDASILDRIFEPYFTTKTKGKGTGLGLSVVHGIIKNSGGMLTVESQVGEGSVFSAFLPLLRKTAAADIGEEALLTQ
jgi:signal transduction histidine kinase